MSRAGVAGLGSPRPFIETLPALYQEDPFTQRFTGAFDDVLAPIWSTIDNIGAYLDPALTPPDFLDWLGGWVAALLDETWPIERRRAFVAQAADLHRRRGTLAGLTDHIRVFTDGEVQVVENGGAAWSQASGGPLPGTARPALHVRVAVARAADVDPARLDALVAAAKPAHLGHTVEVVVARRAAQPS
jgi:phage tail-like protein